jgi:hypothetical protein
MLDRDSSRELQEALVNAMKDQLASEDCPASTLEVVRKLLKDNQVSTFGTGLEEPMEQLGNNLTALPFLRDGERAEVI